MRQYTQARQLDRCEVCNEKEYKYRLTWMVREWLNPEGSNYFTYSDPSDTNLWTVDDATAKGVISYGPWADMSRVSIATDDTVTEVKGSPTYSGTGTVRTTTSVDVSAWDSLVFSCEVGGYQQSQDTYTIAIGFCSSDGNTLYEVKSVSTRSARRHWFVVNGMANLPVGVTDTAAYFYCKVTPSATGWWWIDSMQLEKNVTKAGEFIRTTGSTVDRSAVSAIGVKKVCPDCVEWIPQKSELVGKPRVATELPIETLIQEL